MCINALFISLCDNDLLTQTANLALDSVFESRTIKTISFLGATAVKCLYHHAILEIQDLY